MMNITKEKSCYLLSPHIALRSWQLVPHAYYVRGQRSAHNLTSEEFSVLARCNGQEPIEDSEVLQNLVKHGMCAPCKQGTALDEWQTLKLYENRYFSAIAWEITGRCNLNCLHCFNAVDNSPSYDEFTWEECLRLIDEAQACGVSAFTITGGEPMLHPHFMEILREIHARGMMVDRINTNLCLVTQEMLDEMKSFGCVPKLRTSFDGLGHHDWLRNQAGMEEPALEAIRLCIQNGFPVLVHTNVHKLNRESILPTAELLDRMGVSTMKIIRTSESPRWLLNSEKVCEGGACLAFEEYYDTMLEFAHGYAAKPHKMSIDIWQFLNIYPKAKRYRYRPVWCYEGEYRDSRAVCSTCREISCITAGGEMSPCLEMSGVNAAAGVKLGNVKEQGLKAIFTKSSYLDAVCTTVKHLAEQNELCRNCRFWKLCVGGCRVLGFGLTGNQMGEDKAKCIFFHKNYIDKTDAAFADSGFLPVQTVSFRSQSGG